MHKLPSKSAIVRFRIAALLYFAKCLLCPVSVGILLYAFLLEDRDLAYIGIGTLVLTMLVIVFQWLIASRTRCPLCVVPVLANPNCSKNRQARTLFGSYRLKVAVSILLRNSFRCPYCNEPTALEVRNRSNPYSRS